MVLKNQNKRQRYENSVAIFLLGGLVLVLVIRFGILLQRSESDLISISNQIRGYKPEITIQTSHVKLVPQGKPNVNQTTGSQNLTGAENNSGAQINTD